MLGGDFVLSGGDQIKNLLSKGDNNTACEGQEAVCSLAGIVALERKTDLHNAEAEHDQTDCTDKTENESGQVVDHLQRVGGCGINRGHAEGADEHSGDKDREHSLCGLGHLIHWFLSFLL